MLSALGLGSSAFGEVYESGVTQEQVDEVVHCAIKAGVNVIDTAFWYGQGLAEERLGKALQHIPRQAYYVHTKCCRYEKDVDKMFDFSAERTLAAVDDAIARLGCGYLDAMQIHDPEYAPSVDILVEQTLPALQKAKDAGKIKQIGLTGYPLALHRELIERSTVQIDTCLFYCHYSMHDTSLVDSGMLDFLDAKGVGCLNASPLSMGLLTERGPPAWHPATPEIKAVCRDAAMYCKAEGVALPRLAVDFSLRHPRIPTTFLSTNFVEQMERNIDAVRNLGKLSEKEQAVEKHINTTFFEPLGNASWEGVELKAFADLKQRVADGDTNAGTISTI
ncbi:L-galactose dehydrogenase (At-GalDH) (L-GalDH) [Durusdinium trenchii]|uniref:L-galactose dehydrogenase (At-GalDH) (L-GalDH) n=1 Tax=Durusdinium trenchii TaxID=1381693 RepID=A0ABP0I2R1_9DINO